MDDHHLLSSHVNVHEPHRYPAHPPPPHAAEPLAFLPKQHPLENGIPYGHGTSAAHTHFPDDVVLYVGTSRRTFHVNAQTLIAGSAYFKNLLHYAHSQSSQAVCHVNPSGGLARPSIVIDCEEGTFESLLLLMRYGTLEALPPMSAAEVYRVKKEAEFYGIHFTEPPSPRGRAAAESGDVLSDMSRARSQLSSPCGSPKSTMNTSPGPVADKVAGGRRYDEDARLACKITARRLAELPEFPVDLADPARLVLVSCLDQDKSSIYACDCVAHSSERPPVSRSTQWALNFHHGYAFCTSCGHQPNMSPKHFSEMFMAAAAHFSPGQSASRCAWQVISDSTCILRFISSAGYGHDACGCSAGGARAAKEAAHPTIWAANCFYLHAFCTRCGAAAKGPVLLSLILALRYGARNIKVR